MSDNWITVVPVDPYLVPDKKSRIIALMRYHKMVADADEIESVTYVNVHFFDCGANFERIVCPACREEVSSDWWNEHMDLDRRDDVGFKLDGYSLPCCSRQFTLNELIYDWPQRFGKFALEAMNPNVGRLTQAQRLELESALGTKLCVIYRHV